MSYGYKGYTGIAQINNKHIRCSDFSVNQVQESLFYDHTIGLNDTIPSDATTKGEDVGVIQTQNVFMRPSPISIAGSISFPAACSLNAVNFTDLFSYAKYGNYFDIDYKYYCNNGRKFIDCRVNSFGFSISAGDILNISADVMAMDMVDSDSLRTYTAPEKMVTWDKVQVSISGDAGVVILDRIQSINFTIANNVTPIYTISPDPALAIGSYKHLLPKDLRIGLQTVTGEIVVYGKEGRDFITPSTGQGNISVSCVNFSTSINVVMQPKQITGSGDIMVTTIPFVGVDMAFGA